MIIVSQDKTKIVNFNNLTQIYITQDEEKTAFFIRHETVDSLYDDLGFYKTEERAKEVLADIANIRAIIEIYKCSNDDTQDIFDKKMLKENLIFDTYEMPED